MQAAKGPSFSHSTLRLGETSPGEGDPSADPSAAASPVAKATQNLKAQAKQDPQAKSLLERAAEGCKTPGLNPVVAGLIYFVATYSVVGLIALHFYERGKDPAQGDGEAGKSKGQSGETGATNEGEGTGATDGEDHVRALTNPLVATPVRDGKHIQTDSPGVDTTHIDEDSPEDEDLPLVMVDDTMTDEGIEPQEQALREGEGEGEGEGDGESVTQKLEKEDAQAELHRTQPQASTVNPAANRASGTK